MKEYLFSLVALALCCAVVEHLSPGGQGGAWSKYLRLLCSLCLLLALVEPISALLSAGVDLPARIEDYLSSLSEEAEYREQAQQQWSQEQQRLDCALVAAALSQELQREFSIAAQDVALSVRADAAGERLVSVSVGLSGSAIWQDTHAIEGWLAQQIGSSATVTVYLK